jgi:hypothetical protein
MRLPLLIAFVAACGGAAATGTPPDNNVAEAPPSEDEAFQRFAAEVARRSQRTVIGSGTVGTHRYAAMEPTDINDGRGAYLLEEAPGRYWLVSVYWDGKTQPWTGGGATIDHQQAHRAGYETVSFTLAGGRLGVVAREVLSDARDLETPERQEYDCPASCPDLDGFEADADFKVSGPGATADELLE